MTEREMCTACVKPRPRDFCWAGTRLDCPFKMPPSHLTVDDLWGIIVDLSKRVCELEDQLAPPTHDCQYDDPNQCGWPGHRRQKATP
jgi:hypothetical protein